MKCEGEKVFHKIIKEICVNKQIDISFLSKKWIIKLEKDNKIRYICGYKFCLNDHSIGCILDDKFAFYSILKDKGIPVVEHKIIYNFNNRNEYAKGSNNFECIRELYFKNNNHIVIKPNNGTCGVDVYHSDNLTNIDKLLERVLKKYFSISICPYYHIIAEYRVIVLKNDIKVIYEKRKPLVYGDGKKTVKDLLCEFNPKYFSKLELDNRILNKDEIYEYSWKYNLSGGAICKLYVEDEIKNKIKSIALSVSKILNIVFGSIDIIRTEDGSLYVLEANSGVMMDNFINQIPNGYNIAKSIYEEAIVNMFD